MARKVKLKSLLIITLDIYILLFDDMKYKKINEEAAIHVQIGLVRDTVMSEVLKKIDIRKEVDDKCEQVIN